MLEDIGYDDMPVVYLLSTGIKLVGDLEEVGIWREEDHRAVCSVNTLWANAKDSQRKVLAPRSSDEMESVLWDNTMAEVSDGCLKGPLSR